LIALLVAPPSSRAETQPLSNSQSCGATTDESLAAAQKALQSKDKETRGALVCLLAATMALNKRVTDDEDGHPQSGILHLPVVPITPQQYR